MEIKTAKDEVAELKKELVKITSSMHIPSYHRDTVTWLLKNMEKRNKSHPEFEQALDICNKLKKMGC